MAHARVSSIEFRASYFGFWASYFRFRASYFGFRNGFGTSEGLTDALHLPVSCFVFRISGIGFRFRVSGTGFAVPQIINLTGECVADALRLQRPHPDRQISRGLIGA